MKSSTSAGRNIVMRQRWSDLLFLHWAIDPEEIQSHLPEGLVVDTYAGRAYIGIVAFSMSNVALSFFAPIPGMSDFLECNVRTYVRLADSTQPGIWFFSLDAANPVMAALARASYSLPYYFAHMSMKQERTQSAGGWKKTVAYDLQRSHPGAPQAVCHIEYELMPGIVRPARFASIEDFLVERYLLYAYRNSHIYSARVHHAPYQIESANLLSLEQTLISAAGLDMPDQEPMVHFTREILADIEPPLLLGQETLFPGRLSKVRGALPQPA